MRIALLSSRKAINFGGGGGGGAGNSFSILDARSESCGGPVGARVFHSMAAITLSTGARRSHAAGTP